MNRLPIITKLSWIAFYLSIGQLAIDILLIFAVPPVLEIIGATKPERSIQAVTLIVLRKCCVLPFSGVCLWSALQKQITQNKSMAVLILSSVLYVTDGIGANIISLIIGRIITPVQYANANMINIISGYLNIVPWQTVSLVLICCAMSIELFIFKNKESET